jgi:hypothetical protein
MKQQIDEAAREIAWTYGEVANLNANEMAAIISKHLSSGWVKELNTLKDENETLRQALDKTVWDDTEGEWYCCLCGEYREYAEKHGHHKYCALYVLPSPPE